MLDDADQVAALIMAFRWGRSPRLEVAGFSNRSALREAIGKYLVENSMFYPLWSIQRYPIPLLAVGVPKCGEISLLCR